MNLQILILKSEGGRKIFDFSPAFFVRFLQNFFQKFGSRSGIADFGKSEHSETRPCEGNHAFPNCR